MLADGLHFLRPEFLLLIPIAIGFWLFIKKAQGANDWENFIPKAMVDALRVNHTKQSQHWQLALLAMWITISFAASGPSWQKQEVPLFENPNALVIALDLSPSMLAQDLKPSRLDRAKFKLIDLLRTQADGQIALIAYAGDAHTVSPLTDDPKTIEALLPALHPNIMPSPGSNIEQALIKAQQLLVAAGAYSGKIIFITDGIDASAIKTLQSVASPDYDIAILATATSKPVPIPGANNGFLKTPNGEIVLAQFDQQQQKKLSQQFGAKLTMIRTDNGDILQVLGDSDINNAATILAQPKHQLSDDGFEVWDDMGYLFALLSLPLVLVFFRRGLVYLLPFIVVPTLLINPQQAQAQELAKPNWLEQSFKNNDQKAMALYQQKKYSDAANKFTNNEWSALANYKNGDYQRSIEQFNQGGDIKSQYNKANALALNGNYKEALQTYDDVLSQDPQHVDAAHNKSLLESLLEQSDSEQSDSEQSDSEQSDSEQSDSEQSDSEQSDSEQSDSEQSDSEQSDSEQSDSEQSDSEQSDSEQSDSEQSDSEQSDSEPSDSEQSDSEQSDSEQSDSEQSDSEPSESENTDPEQQSAENKEEQGQTSALAKEGKPLKDSSEQWLRSIPDDPSGLLRRKFEYQAQQRRQNPQTKQSNTNSLTRY